MTQQEEPKNERRDRKPWTEDEVRAMLEKARNPFLHVVKKDGLALVWTRERDFALQAILKDNYFQKCSEESIVNAVKNLVFIGLSLNPQRQHAVIHPKFNKRGKYWEAVTMTMYRGLMHLANEAGAHGLKAEVVYRDDKFRYGSNTDGDWYEYELNHLAERADQNFTGAFVSARMPAGTLKVEWVPKKDIYKMRDSSESYLDDNGKPRHGSPWVMWFDEMAKKSSLKRASKRWEEMMGSSEKWERFIRAVNIDNEQEGVIAPRATDIEGKAEEKSEEPLLLTHDQVENILAQVTSAQFRTQICNAYGVKKIEEIPAGKFEEISQRIQAAKVTAAEKKAKKKGSSND